MKKRKWLDRVALLLIALFSWNTTVLAAPHVQATLSKEKGDWQLEDLNTKTGNVDLTKGAWVGVRLSGECSRGILGLTRGTCQDKEFQSYSPNINNIRNPFIWPLGLAFSPLIALLGGEFDQAILPISVDSKFDEKAFGKALNEAYNREGGGERFPGLISRYSELYEAAEKADILLSTPPGDTGHDQSAKEAHEEYLKGMEMFASDAFRIKVKDESGFWASSDNLKAGDDFRFQAKELDLPQFATPSYEDYQSNVERLQGNFFPAEDLKDFASRLEGGDELLETLQVENARLEKNNRAVFDRVGDENGALFTKFATSLKRRNGQVLVKETGRLTQRLKNDSFVFDLNVPDQVAVNNGRATSGSEATLTIKGRNFENVLPDSYAYRNNDLGVSLDGRTLHISNKTDTYISLDALTLYHQEDVLSLGGEYLREIPPGSKISISLNAFSLRVLKDDYYSLTRDKARNIKVTFGFACKYRRTDLTKARSFVETKESTLLDLLSKQWNVAVR